MKDLPSSIVVTCTHCGYAILIGYIHNNGETNTAAMVRDKCKQKEFFQGFKHVKCRYTNRKTRGSDPSVIDDILIQNFTDFIFYSYLLRGI